MGSTQVDLTPRVRDWTPIREAFVKRTEKPSFDELSLEFSLPPATIKSTCYAQSWPILRANFVRSEMAVADIGEKLLAILSDEKIVTERFKNAVLVGVEKITLGLDGADAIKSDSRKASLIQTYTFALLNLSAAVKNLGVVGSPKQLRELADGAESGEGWRKGVLVTINNLVGPAVGSVSVGPATAEKSVSDAGV